MLPEKDGATATGICRQTVVKIGPAVPEICSRTDRQTHRQADRNTAFPYKGGVTIKVYKNGTDAKICGINMKYTY